jgi:hypothetical protein
VAYATLPFHRSSTSPSFNGNSDGQHVIPRVSNHRCSRYGQSVGLWKEPWAEERRHIA